MQRSTIFIMVLLVVVVVIVVVAVVVVNHVVNPDSKHKVLLLRLE